MRLITIKQPEVKIRKIRELKSYSQEYIADKLGLSTRAYSKIESGETQLTIHRLNEISEILEIDPLEIIGFDDKQVFNHCNQHGNIGINHVSIPDDLIALYKYQIQELKDSIAFLRAQLDKKS